MQVHQAPLQSGLTLIELTVTVSVITSLTSVLFMSAEYYKSASDRASCITQMHSIQKSVRSYQNLNGLAQGDPLSSTDLIGTGKPLPQSLACPRADGSYTFLTQVPNTGQSYATCSSFNSQNGTSDSSQDHSPPSIANW